MYLWSFDVPEPGAMLNGGGELNLLRAVERRGSSSGAEAAAATASADAVVELLQLQHCQQA